jgi:D-alanine-D-alanine ligase
MKRLQVGVIIGGAQQQKQINISHSEDIAQALKQLGHGVKLYELANPSHIKALLDDHANGCLDIVFNNAAGKRGGDGTVEGLLELAGVPFVGSDAHATACAFDKQTTRQLVQGSGVPVSPGFVVEKATYVLGDILDIADSMGYPLVVKAVRGSDSLGVSLVKKSSEIAEALNLAFEHDNRALIESYVERSADITCMVIGTGKEAVALTPAESVFEGEIYTDEVADLTETRLPQLDAGVIEKVKQHAVEAHRALACSDYSRSDFLVDKNGHIFFLELNAHAGLGKDSCTMFITKVSRGWDHEATIKEILNLALQRQGVR